MVSIGIGSQSGSGWNRSYGKYGYDCEEGGCRRRKYSGKFRTNSACRDKCRKEFYKCDREDGCDLVHSDLNPEERAAEGLFNSEGECKAKCSQYYECNCSRKCRPSFSSEAIGEGQDTPRPGILFPNTPAGLEACQAAENCAKMCTWTIGLIVGGALVGAAVIALVAYLIYRSRDTIADSAVRFKERVTSPFASSAPGAPAGKKTSTTSTVSEKPSVESSFDIPAPPPAPPLPPSRSPSSAR